MQAASIIRVASTPQLHKNQLGGMGEAHAYYRTCSFAVQLHPSFGMSIAPLLYPLPVLVQMLRFTARGEDTGEGSGNFYATKG